MKTVAVGVCGGIGAYKLADLVSRLTKEGYDVHVIMTPAATEFITPLTMRTLSGNPVLTGVFSEQSRWKVQHIGLATDMDLMVIAPATANTIAKLAYGLADNLLTAITLATRAPVLVVPSMNTNMYEHPATQQNIARLAELGYRVMEPAEGELACGVKGKGRLPAIDDIYDQVVALMQDQHDLKDIKILVTSGPTCEDIDPVRYISNRSTGKMGYAIAEQAALRGAEVTLVSGPTNLPTPPGVACYRTRSARDMYAEVLKHYEECQVVIGAAAVADYRPEECADHKIKKQDDDLVINLTRNPDILAQLGENKGQRLLVGFAAETQDLLINGAAKMKKKNLDLLVANDVTMAGAGFASDTNVVSIMYRNGEVKALPLMSKREVASAVLDQLALLMNGSAL
ncbi:MAG: bifunctional phosphopantothenoylcysteine decarboxylase/phosphopantothenate--cysteine ligase CoaBC [Methylocystaceae bacterium]